MDATISGLLVRVRAGNGALSKVWREANAVAERPGEWGKRMDRVSAAWPKLDAFCTELRLRGYRDCAYLENGVKTRRCERPGELCWVCPSDNPYWRTEC